MSSVHSAFMAQSNPFSMEALLNRPQLTTGVMPSLSNSRSHQRLSAHRQFSFPPPAVSSAASSAVINPYLNYPLPSGFPGAAAMSPAFFMSQLAAFSGLNQPKLIGEKFSDHESSHSDEDTRRKEH